MKYAALDAHGERVVAVAFAALRTRHTLFGTAVRRDDDAELGELLEHRAHIGNSSSNGRPLSDDGGAALDRPLRAPPGRTVRDDTNASAKLDGSEARLLEPDRAEIPDGSLHPRFSPDGRWVVFTSDRGHMNDEWPITGVPQPYGDLWAVPVAGGAAVRFDRRQAGGRAERLGVCASHTVAAPRLASRQITHGCAFASLHASTIVESH